MPTPATSGHPRDWRTAKQAPRHGRQMKAQAAANSRLLCRVPGAPGRAPVSPATESLLDATLSPLVH